MASRHTVEVGSPTYISRTFGVILVGMTFLGVAITIPSVAWPSISDDLGRPLAQLGFVSLAYGGGYTAATLGAGILARRIRTGAILFGSALLGVGTTAFVAVSPGWISFLVGILILGSVGGFTDSTVNTYVAIRRGTGSMGVLHGMFGVGAVLGPLIVAGLLTAGTSWRLAFVGLAIGQGIYAGGLFLYGRQADVPAQASPRGEGGLRLSRTLFWSVAVFFAYAGVAAGTAIWAFTYLTEFRGYGTGAGGVIVAAYWGGFTASRFMLGVVGDRIHPNGMLRWSGIMTIVGLVAFWQAPSSSSAVIALVFTGFAHGPVFPLEILLTPRRFGTSHTANVVGFEIAALNVGGALLPATIGLLVSVWGLGVIPPAIFGFSIVLLGCIEMLRRATGTAAESTESAAV
jgi:fucose permease